MGWMRFAGALLCAAGLAGCAATSVDKAYVPSADKQEGVIVVSVTHEGARSSAAKAIVYLNGGITGKNGQTLFSQVEAVPMIPKPKPSDFRSTMGYLYALPLPAGSHEFTNWQITGGTGARYFPKSAPPLKFELKAGEVLYLGNLNGNMATGKNVFGMRIVAGGYVEVKDQFDRDMEAMDRLFPQLKGRVVKALLPVGPWIEASGELNQVIDPPPPVTPLPKK